MGILPSIISMMGMVRSSSPEPLPPWTSDFVRIGQNDYPVVQIGSQYWIAENLREQIGEIGVDCFYCNNDSSRSEDGFLYKKETIFNSNGSLKKYFASLLPNGWRLPTYTDIDNLEGFIGTGAGKKLKSTTGWIYSYGGTDDYGFNGKPLGYMEDGAWDGIGSWVSFMLDEMGFSFGLPGYSNNISMNYGEGAYIRVCYGA